MCGGNRALAPLRMVHSAVRLPEESAGSGSCAWAMPEAFSENETEEA